jgi:hypothetical protein
MDAPPMSPKLLMILTCLFFVAWRKAADSFLLFCALFAAGLWVCVVIYRMDGTGSVIDEESR